MSDLLDPGLVRLPQLSEGWQADGVEWTTRRVRFQITSPAGDAGAATLTRCVGGPLPDAYPVASHDLELTLAMPAGRSQALGVLARGALAADPKCRRVVVAVPADDGDARTDAVDAGLRSVVVVDLPDASGASSWELMVLEPEWVTKVDIHLDKVPGT